MHLGFMDRVMTAWSINVPCLSSQMAQAGLESKENHSAQRRLSLVGLLQVTAPSRALSPSRGCFYHPGMLLRRWPVPVRLWVGDRSTDCAHMFSSRGGSGWRAGGLSATETFHELVIGQHEWSMRGHRGPVCVSRYEYVDHHLLPLFR